LYDRVSTGRRRELLVAHLRCVGQADGSSWTAREPRQSTTIHRIQRHDGPIRDRQHPAGVDPHQLGGGTLSLGRSEIFADGRDLAREEAYLHLASEPHTAERWFERRGDLVGDRGSV
jgi:hypothetical protein